MNAKPNVTLRDIARLLGLSHATVSRALNNHPAIPLETRRRIHSAAKKVGYRRNVVVSMLMSQLRKYPVDAYQGNLAFITTDSTEDGWRLDKPYNVRMFNGAQKRARTLGYTLEAFWVKAPDLTAKRAVNILRTRGIRGLIIAPMPKGIGHLSLDWSHFATATIGYTMNSPHLHCVKNDHYYTMGFALRKLIHLNYRRIGFVLSPLADKYAEGRLSARYLLYAHELATEMKVPIFTKTEDVFGSRNDTFNEFRAWYERYKPDAIICMGQKIYDFLKQMNVSVPEGVGVVYLDIHNAETSSITGIDECEEEVASAAVDLIVQQVEHNDLGIPKSPKSVLMEGQWIKGQTVANRSKS